MSRSRKILELALKKSEILSEDSEETNLVFAPENSSVAIEDMPIIFLNDVESDIILSSEFNSNILDPTPTE